MRRWPNLSAPQGANTISIEIDVDNYPVMNACFAAGFQVLDFRRTHIVSVSCERAFEVVFVFMTYPDLCLS